MQEKNSIFYTLKKDSPLNVDELCYLSKIKYHILISTINELQEDGLIKIKRNKVGSDLVSII